MRHETLASALGRELQADGKNGPAATDSVKHKASSGNHALLLSRGEYGASEKLGWAGGVAVERAHCPLHCIFVMSQMTIFRSGEASVTSVLGSLSQTQASSLELYECVFVSLVNGDR